MAYKWEVFPITHSSWPVYIFSFHMNYTVQTVPTAKSSNLILCLRLNSAEKKYCISVNFTSRMTLYIPQQLVLIKNSFVVFKYKQNKFKINSFDKPLCWRKQVQFCCRRWSSVAWLRKYLLCGNRSVIISDG